MKNNMSYIVAGNWYNNILLEYNIVINGHSISSTLIEELILYIIIVILLKSSIKTSGRTHPGRDNNEK